MTKIIIKHIKPGFTRDFNRLKFDSEIRANWIRENQDKYFTVAELNYDLVAEKKAMNIAYSRTQNQQEPWSLTLNYPTNKIYDFAPDTPGHRSTQTGDIFIVNDVEYFVDSYGFTLTVRKQL